MSLLVSAGKGALTRSSLLCPIPTVTVLAETRRYASRKRAKARKARSFDFLIELTASHIFFQGEQPACNEMLPGILFMKGRKRHLPLAPFLALSQDVDLWLV
jgi:hypothetical protein